VIGSRGGALEVRTYDAASPAASGFRPSPTTVRNNFILTRLVAVTFRAALRFVDFSSGVDLALDVERARY